MRKPTLCPRYVSRQHRGVDIGDQVVVASDVVYQCWLIHLALNPKWELAEHVTSCPCPAMYTFKRYPCFQDHSPMRRVGVDPVVHLARLSLRIPQSTIPVACRYWEERPSACAATAVPCPHAAGSGDDSPPRIHRKRNSSATRTLATLLSKMLVRRERWRVSLYDEYTEP